MNIMRIFLKYMCNYYNGKWISGTSFGETTGSFHKGSKCSYITKKECDDAYNWNFIKQHKNYRDYNVIWFQLPIAFLNFTSLLEEPRSRSMYTGSDELWEEFKELLKKNYKYFTRDKLPPNFEETVLTYGPKRDKAIEEGNNRVWSHINQEETQASFSLSELNLSEYEIELLKSKQKDQKERDLDSKLENLAFRIREKKDGLQKIGKVGKKTFS